MNDDDLKFIPLDINPSNTLDGISINSDCNNIYIGFPPLGMSSSPISMSNSPTNSNLNSNNNMGYYPTMPYPTNIPSMDNINTTPISSPNQNMYDNEFPSETSSNDLYSYNTDDSRCMDYCLNSINPLDILRNFDLTIYYDDSRDYASNKTIDEIFDCIKTDNSGIFSTLKAYRIPLPIASLIVKKIIKITLEHK